MRKCKAQLTYMSGRPQQDPPTVICGKFHCWGTTYEEFDNGGVQVTMAIIELEDGKIIMTHPESVTFIDDELIQTAT